MVERLKYVYAGRGQRDGLPVLADLQGLGCSQVLPEARESLTADAAHGVERVAVLGAIEDDVETGIVLRAVGLPVDLGVGMDIFTVAARAGDVQLVPGFIGDRVLGRAHTEAAGPLGCRGGNSGESHYAEQSAGAERVLHGVLSFSNEWSQSVEIGVKSTFGVDSHRLKSFMSIGRCPTIQVG